MKRLSLLFLFGLSISVLLSSCKHTYYIPNTHNVPMFKEKNELRASISNGEAEHIKTLDFQGAYSITNHIALMGSYMEARGGNYSAGNGGKGTYSDLALGYYRTVGENGVLEAFAGYGISHQQHRYNSKSPHVHNVSSMSYMKYFIQPSIGITTKYIDLAFSPRFSQVSFYNFSTNLESSHDEYPYLDTLSRNRTSYLFEPAITIRGGWQYIKLQLQISDAKILSGRNLPFEKSIASIGFSFSLANRYRNTKVRSSPHPVKTYPME